MMHLLALGTLYSHIPSLDRTFTKDKSDIFSVSYRILTENSDHLVIAFALALSLSTGLLKHYKKLDAHKFLEMVGNHFWTYLIEVYIDVKTAWQFLNSNILTFDEQCVPIKSFLLLQGSPV